MLASRREPVVDIQGALGSIESVVIHSAAVCLMPSWKEVPVIVPLKCLQQFIGFSVELQPASAVQKCRCTAWTCRQGYEWLPHYN